MHPGIEMPGYFQNVPAGQGFAALRLCVKILQLLHGADAPEIVRGGVRRVGEHQRVERTGGGI
jgi:ABC-type amino acid transport system permease subunit